MTDREINFRIYDGNQLPYPQKLWAAVLGFPITLQCKWLWVAAGALSSLMLGGLFVGKSKVDGIGYGIMALLLLLIGVLCLAKLATMAIVHDLVIGDIDEEETNQKQGYIQIAAWCWIVCREASERIAK